MSRLSSGRAPALLAGAGAALLVLSLFAPWFSASREMIELPDRSTGWEWLSGIDLYLFVVALAAAAATVARPDDRRLPSLAAYGAALGMLAVILRAINTPDYPTRFIVETEVKAGPFIAVLALSAIIFATAPRARLPR